MDCSTWHSKPPLAWLAVDRTTDYPHPKGQPMNRETTKDYTAKDHRLALRRRVATISCLGNATGSVLFTVPFLSAPTKKTRPVTLPAYSPRRTPRYRDAPFPVTCIQVSPCRRATRSLPPGENAHKPLCPSATVPLASSLCVSWLPSHWL